MINKIGQNGTDYIVKGFINLFLKKNNDFGNIDFLVKSVL